MAKYFIERLPTVGRIQVFRVREKTEDGTEYSRVDWHPPLHGGNGRMACSSCVYHRGALELKRSHSCKHVQAVKRFVQRQSELEAANKNLKNALNIILNLE